MKADYEKPTIEFEEYELNAAIATGCQTIISLGPGDDVNSVCDEYKVELYARSRSVDPFNGNFYEGSCSCYLSAGDGTLATS